MHKVCDYALELFQVRVLSSLCAEGGPVLDFRVRVVVNWREVREKRNEVLWWIECRIKSGLRDVERIPVNFDVGREPGFASGIEVDSCILRIL